MLVVITALAVFVALVWGIAAQRVDALDVAIMRVVERLDSGIADWVFGAITHAGSRPLLFAVIGVVGAWALVRRRGRIFWILLAHGVVCAASNFALKVIFARERPRPSDPLVLVETPSFPSGHAMDSLAVYGAVLAVVIRFWPRARAAAIPLVAMLIFAIGVSRIYLGRHWPSDVIGGFVAATPLLVVTLGLLRREHARP